MLPESNENFHPAGPTSKRSTWPTRPRSSSDPDKRRDLYYQIQQIHKDDGRCVYLYVVPYIDVLNKKIKDFFHHPMGQYVFAKMSVES